MARVTSDVLTRLQNAELTVAEAIWGTAWAENGRLFIFVVQSCMHSRYAKAWWPVRMSIGFDHKVHFLASRER